MLRCCGLGGFSCHPRRSWARSRRACPCLRWPHAHAGSVWLTRRFARWVCVKSARFLAQVPPFLNQRQGPFEMQVAADLAEQELTQAASRVPQDPMLPVVVMDFLLPVVCGESFNSSTYVWKKAAGSLGSAS